MGPESKLCVEAGKIHVYHVFLFGIVCHYFKCLDTRNCCLLSMCERDGPSNKKRTTTAKIKRVEWSRSVHRHRRRCERTRTNEIPREAYNYRFDLQQKNATKGDEKQVFLCVCVQSLSKTMDGWKCNSPVWARRTKPTFYSFIKNV